MHLRRISAWEEDITYGLQMRLWVSNKLRFFLFAKIKSVDLLVKIMYFSRHAKVPREKLRIFLKLEK